ncbi:carbohydrate ABC transporter permease [Luedemannella helvata]|uniref:Carbohydrate ABC transporter permease n=1 Tax=Luedemannella helvata TaxID=349315 RepID=A0ABN2KNV3_9ACTN
MAVITTSSAPRRGKGRRGDDMSNQVVGRTRIGGFFANTAGIILAIIMIFPAYWMINTAFKPANEILTFEPHFFPQHPTFDNIISAVKAPNFLLDLRNGLIITLLSTVSAIVVGFLGALAIARFRFYGRKALIVVILMVQMVPFIALLIPVFLLLNAVELTNTLTGITLLYMVLFLPYTIWTLRGFIANIPRELDEAALVDGCSRWQTFYRVILPLTGPGLVATSIYGFIQAWNEFIIIQTVNRPDHQNLMAWLVSNQTSRGTFWGPMMASALITSIPVVVFFLVIQRNIAAGLTAGAVKG